MGNMRNNEKGFGTVEIILIIVIVALIGAVGWFVYKNHNKIATTATTTNTTSTAPAKTTTTTPVKPVDPYAGWKSYCDTSTGGCFKYPSDWADVSTLDAQSVKAFTQNKAGTINLEYSEPVNGKGGLGDFATASLDALTTANSSYKIAGGYYTVGNIPGYNLIDTGLVQQYGLAIGKTSNISDSNELDFTKNSNKATLVVHYNNTTGSSSISTSQANTWFSSADGKTALLIAQSYYNQ